MPITRDEVRHIAELARLKFTEEDLERFSRQLGDILGYVEKLNELDLDGVEPLSSVQDTVNVQDPDDIRPGLDRETAMENAPVKNGIYYSVPRVVGDDDGE